TQVSGKIQFDKSNGILIICCSGDLPAVRRCDDLNMHETLRIHWGAVDQAHSCLASIDDGGLVQHELVRSPGIHACRAKSYPIISFKPFSWCVTACVGDLSVYRNPVLYLLAAGKSQEIANVLEEQCAPVLTVQFDEILGFQCPEPDVSLHDPATG